MALFEEQITDTLETGAPSIKYEGDEGPQDPRQEQALMQLKEEYMEYVFSQKELGEPVLSFEEWYQMMYEASKMGVQAPQEEMMSEEMMMREPAAYGGIMDTESGRRMYGFGSIFKKITKPFKKVGKKLVGGAKKVLKSPLGKAAALYFAPALIPGGASTMGGVLKNAMSSRLPMDWAGKLAREGKSNKGILSAAKKFLTGNKGIAAAGIGALSSLPLLGIGTQKQQQVVPDMGKLGSFDFDYDKMIRDVKGAKTTEDLAALNTKYGTDLIEDINVYDYAQGGRIGYAGGEMVEGMAEGVEKVGRGGSEIMEKIKEGIIEGGKGVAGPFIDEAIWIEKIKDFIRKKRGEGRPMPRRPMPDMPRRGYALGAKADFAIEDVMTGGMEDEIGGITGIMRQADLQRKGNVGQFYAAEGGVAGMREALKNKGYDWLDNADDTTVRQIFNSEMGTWTASDVWRPGKKEGGIMDLGGMEKDYRNTGGFVDLGAKEKADDVPARLSVNEFVMTADAVRGAGDGDIDKGASIMENMMKELEQKGQEDMKMAGPDWYIKRIEHLMFLGYDYDEAAEIAYDTEKYNEVIGSDPFARKQGASDMFEVSERLSEVV